MVALERALLNILDVQLRSKQLKKIYDMGLPVRGLGLCEIMEAMSISHGYGPALELSRG